MGWDEWLQGARDIEYRLTNNEQPREMKNPAIRHDILDFCVRERVTPDGEGAIIDQHLP
jgi:hypothetical protein